jgi:hypothetical protein
MISSTRKVRARAGSASSTTSEGCVDALKLSFFFGAHLLEPGTQFEPTADPSAKLKLHESATAAARAEELEAWYASWNKREWWPEKWCNCGQ